MFKNDDEVVLVQNEGNLGTPWVGVRGRFLRMSNPEVAWVLAYMPNPYMSETEIRVNIRHLQSVTDPVPRYKYYAISC